MKTTTAGYSISNEAYSMLQNHSEQRYGKDGIAGHVIVDAIRFNLETDDTDTFEKQQYNDVDADLEGFSFQRGETKEVHFRIQEELLEEFRNQARQVYSQRKIGKYLSRCVYVYVYERAKKAFEAVDTSTGTDSVAEELYDNYSGLEYVPDTDAEIPKSRKYAIPLLITIFKNKQPERYTDNMISSFATYLQDYVDVSNKSVENYIQEIKDEHMTEIAPIWTGLSDVDIEKMEGYVFLNEGSEIVQQYVDEWAQEVLEYLSEQRPKSTLNKIKKYAIVNIERYENTEIDTSAVEELEELIDEKIEDGDYIL